MNVLTYIYIGIFLLVFETHLVSFYNLVVVVS